MSSPRSQNILGMSDYAPNFGQCIELRREDGTSQKTVIQVTGCGPRFQGLVTVTLAVAGETYEDNQPEYRNNVIATVQFGIAGAAMQAEIDFKTGTQLTLPADSLTVRAGYLEVGSFSPLVTRLCASLGGNTRSSNYPNTRTIPRQIVPAGGSVSVGVPPFADGYFVTSPASGAALTGLVIASGADQSVGYSGGQALQAIDLEAAAAAAATGGVKLPNSARGLTIDNTGGTNIPLAVVFTLAL